MRIPIPNPIPIERQKQNVETNERKKADPTSYASVLMLCDSCYLSCSPSLLFCPFLTWKIFRTFAHLFSCTYRDIRKRWGKKSPSVQQRVTLSLDLVLRHATRFSSSMLWALIIWFKCILKILVSVTSKSSPAMSRTRNTMTKTDFKQSACLQLSLSLAIVRCHLANVDF